MSMLAALQIASATSASVCPVLALTSPSNSLGIEMPKCSSWKFSITR